MTTPSNNEDWDDWFGPKPKPLTKQEQDDKAKVEKKFLTERATHNKEEADRRKKVADYGKQVQDKVLKPIVPIKSVPVKELAPPPPNHVWRHFEVPSAEGGKTRHLLVKAVGAHAAIAIASAELSVDRETLLDKVHVCDRPISKGRGSTPDGTCAPRTAKRIESKK